MAERVNEIPKDPDDLLTYQQVARMLDLSEDTLRRMIADGDWPEPTLFGKQYRWRAGRVSEFMKAVEIVHAVKVKVPQTGLVLPQSDANAHEEGKETRRGKGSG